MSLKLTVSLIQLICKFNESKLLGIGHIFEQKLFDEGHVGKETVERGQLKKGRKT